MRVLIVEDEDNLRLAIGASLRGAGISVDTAVDLQDADLVLTTTTYDCVVFERFLPSGDALNYVRVRRRAGWPTPVLLLTGQDAVADRAASLLLADDYLVKPFAMDELVARVRGLTRLTAIAESPVLQVGDLEIDRERREARRGGVLLPLSAREYAVLELLAAAQGKPVRHTELISHAWHEYSAPTPTALGIVIAQLRRKMVAPTLIETVRGIGYRLIWAFPVTIYLGEESAHRQVQAAVEDLVNTAGAEIIDRDDPIRGSWFRRMRARTSAAAASDLAREAAITAAHALDSRLVLAQDATVTATMMQNLGPVLGALETTKDAVIRVGALLIVKVEWTVAVHQLTAAQQLLLDHHPQLLTSPHDILAALHPSTNNVTGDPVAFAGPSTTTPDTLRTRQSPLPIRNAEHPPASDHPDDPTRPT